MASLHRHHIVPLHAGGTNDPSNIQILTIPEHAEAHLRLFELHGRWQDKLAWRVLSGELSASEAGVEAARFVTKGRKIPLWHRLLLHMARFGKKASPAAREAMRKAQTGRKHPPEVKARIGASQRGKKINPESTKKYVVSRQKTDGRPVFIEGVLYPSHSAAAHAVKDIWGVSLKNALGRIQRSLRTDEDRRQHAAYEKARRNRIKAASR